MAKKFPCAQCGGEVEFSPGSAALVCPYCGASNAIPQSEVDIGEHDYAEQLAQSAGAAATEERLTVRCEECGAESTLEANVTSGECAYCGTNVVLTSQSTRIIRPQALLPFKVERGRALEAFRSWVRSRWFAPSKLKRIASTAKAIVGMYMPSWTYDCKTTSFYRGERGDDYFVNERDHSGKTRKVRKTRWTAASGVVWNIFDDVLVPASDSLPRSHFDHLEPWDLDGLVPYDDGYLAGFRAESYKVDLEQGFEQAKAVMAERIRRTVEQDIGGDRQRVHSVSTRYDGISFKHILLPVWISAYRFGDTVYRFLVNARTGEVQGERPYSWIKIALAIAAALVAIGLLVWLSD